MLGETSVAVELIVLGRTSAAQNPKVTGNTEESVLIAWTEPQYLGGGETPLEYMVEMREQEIKSAKSVAVTQQLKTRVTNLKMGNDT